MSRSTQLVARCLIATAWLASGISLGWEPVVAQDLRYSDGGSAVQPVVVDSNATIDPSMSIAPDVSPVDEGVVETTVPDEETALLDPIFSDYRYLGSGKRERNSWIVGTGDRLGIFSLTFESEDEPAPDKLHIKPSAAIHFISGPNQTDMPPQLYDIDLSFYGKMHITDRLSYDIAIRPGFFADFQGSAREGFRIPAHGVAYYRLTETTELVLGVEHLDRDDIAWLPVGGVVLRPDEDWRLEAVFPKPRVMHRLDNGEAIYVAAEMGGSMWATERDWLVDDVATYRDYRIVLGFQTETDEHIKFWEVGYVFDRRLEYRSGTGSYKPLDTTILRTVLQY